MRRILTGTKVLSGLTYFKRRFGGYINQPFYSLPEEVQEEFLYGRPKSNSRRTVCIYTFLAGHFSRGNDVEGRIELKTCPECQGERICEEAREVSIRGKKIGQLGRMTLTELMAFMQGLVAQNHLSPFGENLAREIIKKGRNLVQAGIGHLTSYRPMPGLSGGEVQRLFLTSHLDHQMDSLIYILDEPTVGLHEVEKADLMELIAGLKALGNSVIVVEHERNTIAHADHVIDFGPLAGAQGGEIVYQGTYAGLLESPDSITGEYLSGRRVLPRKAEEDYEEINRATPQLVTRRVRTNNLKGITAEFPLGVLTGVAGVSGSGKSSLVSGTLVPLLKNHFAEQRARRNGKDFEEENGSAPDTPRPVADRLEGTEHITGFAEISQVPIGRHHNSNPVSYLGIWDSIRKVFAAQPLAQERGYGPGHFSFNSAGACPECRGSGYNRLWLGRSFVYYSCETCGGHRYLDDILEVTYEGANIVDILDMSVSTALGLFRDPPRINAMLEVLQRVGMGYITLGQPAPTLSGGEAQRIKLAKEIGKMRRGHTLYVLDEPTTGLSLYDTVKLLKLLDELVEQGNSIIIIEHDPGVLSYCDWIIELGPGGGNNGGEIIAQGSPADLTRNPASITGPFLKNSADASTEKSTEISTETSDQVGFFE
jgi:excinuclease ABC A subunit